MKRNLLVLGARENSIGDYVKFHAEPEWNVHTVGIDNEDRIIDMSDTTSYGAMEVIASTVFDRPWHAVVCTVGVNHEGVLGTGDGYPIEQMLEDFHLNTLAPLTWLNFWLEFWRKHEESMGSLGNNLHFAVLSSNSAHVPRSTGLPYNASKAALSMAIQCVARDWANRDDRISIYAYEPGWVAGTPMSQQVRRRLPAGAAVSRAPGGRMITVTDLARLIVANLQFGHAINGATIRIDAGEA